MRYTLPPGLTYLGDSDQADSGTEDSEIGVVALTVGTHLTVRATKNIVAAFGISRLVGGLFITVIVAASPELFAT